MDLFAPGLENERVRLVSMDETHRELLRATDAVEHMWNSMPAIKRGAGFDVYFNYMLACQAEGEAYSFAIFDTQTGAFLGVSAFLLPRKVHRRVMIGYTWIDRSARGKGIYAAVQHLMLQRAVVWGARRIEWNVEAHNTRAVNAIKALGANHEGTLRNYARFADGTWVDIAVLSMMRDEAKSAVKAIEAALSLTQA
jgi:RimJ/RimL family protein N-acetyltransferase